MKLVYLETALDDLVWLKRYYTQIFPEGSPNASKQIKNIRELLLANPFIGKQTSETIRELSIPKTPFSYIYRIKDNRIEILRVWDERQER